MYTRLKFILVLMTVGVTTPIGDVLAEPHSTDRLRKGVSRELRVEGISLEKLNLRLDIRIKPTSVTVSLVGTISGEVIAAQTIDGLPKDGDAAIAHVTFTVSQIIKSNQWRAQTRRRVTAPDPPSTDSTDDPPKSEVFTRPITHRTPARTRWFIAASVGRGAGYIAGGTTEQTASQVACCVAFEGTHFRAEVGARLSPDWMGSIAGRLGLNGANIPGHATSTPSLIGRATRTSQPTMQGWSWHLDAGIGLLRHDVVLAEIGPGGTIVDTHLSGGLLVGGGARWATPIGNNVQLYADMNALIGLPVIDTMAIKPQRSLHFDVAIGIAWLN